MRVAIDFGKERVALEVAEPRLVPCRRPLAAPVVTDLAAAVATALEAPLRFPPLRRALTPDDHVTVVVDEALPPLPDLLPPLFEHVARSGVPGAAVGFLFPTEECGKRWREAIAPPYQESRSEVHAPDDRRRLSYLATTRGGRRIYLNRSAVEADQLVVLTRRNYDPLLGYAGSEGALYPALSDDETLRERSSKLSLAAPAEADWPVREEATEVAWLLGAPFFIQVIEGQGDSIAHVLGGVAESAADGERLLDACWRLTVSHPADVVVAGVSGEPSRHGFRELARALACAARVVKPNGRIVLLSRAGGALGPGAQIIRQAEDSQKALSRLGKEHPPDLDAAFQWAHAVQQASVYLLSALTSETAEELVTTPLENVGQVQRLIDTGGDCLIVPDAHKALAVVEG